MILREIIFVMIKLIINNKINTLYIFYNKYFILGIINFVRN